jgi:phosphotransferase system enzyme I (PtsI)
MMTPEGEIHFSGISLSGGIAAGLLYFFRTHEEDDVPWFPITAGQVDHEIARYRRAIARSREDLSNLEFSLHTEGLREAAKIIKVHLEMLNDPVLTVDIEGRVRNEKCNIESIFRNTMQQFIVKFSVDASAFFKERLSDIMDVSARVLGHLRKAPHDYLFDVPAGSIVLANDLDTSIAASAHPAQITAFITSGGTTGSHSALIMRSRGIPYIGQVNTSALLPYIGKYVIVDGQKGLIIINPERETLRKYSRGEFASYQEAPSFGNRAKKGGHLKEYSEARNDENLVVGNRQGGHESQHIGRHPMQLASNAGNYFGLPFSRSEGPILNQKISLMVNVNSLEECDQFSSNDLEGIGLLRSEFLFSGPSGSFSFVAEEATQYQVFRQVVERVKSAPIHIRLFDLGGDKQLPGCPLPFSEKNPLLGCRGVRYLLRHPDYLRVHLRALLRVAHAGDVRLLVPVVSQVEEMKRLRQAIREVSDELTREDISHRRDIQIGCMLEVPSAILLLRHLSRYSDFFSLGTNDLTQYVLGIDRSNPLLEMQYRSVHPSILSLVYSAIQEAKAIQKSLSLCGEIASQPFFTPLLLGLGLDTFSVGLRNLVEIKEQIARYADVQTSELAKKALDFEDADQVTELCWQFMKTASNQETLS